MAYPGFQFLPLSRPFLAGLSAETSRRTMRQALDGIARLIGAEDCLGVQWHLIRFQHANAIKASLNAQYKPATVTSICRRYEACCWPPGSWN